MKKIISILITCILVLSLSSFNSFAKSSPAPQKTYKQETYTITNLNLNTSTTKKDDLKSLNKFFKKNDISDEYNDVSMNLKLKNLKNIEYNKEIPFEASVEATISGEKYKFDASGQLVGFKVSSGDIVYLGLLQGYLDNEEEDTKHANISIHYMPSKNKCFISSSFGTLSEDGNPPLVMNFGELFSEIKEAMDLRNDIRLQNSSQVQQSLTAQALSETDYYPVYQDKDYVNTNYGPIVTSVIYAPRYSVTGKQTSVYGKVGGNIDNMMNYSIYTLGYSDTYNVYINKARLLLYSSNAYYRIPPYDYQPLSGANSVTLYIPLSYGQSIPIFVNTSSTTATTSNLYSTTPDWDHKVQWDFWEALGGLNAGFYTNYPESEDTGMAGKAEFLYDSPLTSSKTLYFSCRGSVTYQITREEYPGRYYYDTPFTTSLTVPALGYCTVNPY